MSIQQKTCVLEVEEGELSSSQVTFHDNLPFLTAVKAFPKITIYTMSVMTGILFMGFDTVIVGTVTAIPRFQQDFGTPSADDNNVWILPAMWVSLWSALGPVGAVVGGFFAGWWQERVGRKWSLGSGSGIAIIAITVMYCSNLPDTVLARRGIFLASKLLQGGSVGVILATTQTYVSEIAPVSLRGPAMALFPAFTLFGQLIGAVVIFFMSRDDSPKSYLISIAAQWPFAALPLVASFLIPQSPTWLLQRERMDEASQSQSRLLTKAVNRATVFEQVKASVALDRQLAAATSYYDCFKGIDRRRMLIVVLASSITNLFGLPLLANASYYMQQVGMSAFHSLLFLIIGIVLGAFANGFGVWVMSRIGRRNLILVSMGITTILWIAMGISGIWQGQVTIWYTAISLMVITIVCGAGCWPASFAVAAEASSLRLRARSQGISVLTSQIGNIVLQLILPYIYNTDAGNLKSKTGFVYAGLCAIGTVLVWYYVPEMKDRTATEIDRMFEAKLPTRAFRGYKRSTSRSHALQNEQ